MDSVSEDDRSSSSENSSSENLIFVFYKSVSGTLGEQNRVYCNSAKQCCAIWDIRKTPIPASGLPDQRHWSRKQRGKPEILSGLKTALMAKISTYSPMWLSYSRRHGGVALQ